MIETHWSECVAACERAGTPYVIVTVLGARGSTPRDAGTKMVVEPETFSGTIGGGELEFRALARARDLLVGAVQEQRVEHFPLGEKLGQCCGGSVSLLFEVCVPDRLPVYLFGAGHVGRALAPLLASLPLHVTWIDARDDAFPPVVPDGVTTLRDEDPTRVVPEAPAGAAFVIMTHNHPLDYALAEAALRRDDAAFVGVIGSASKARRFRLRLAHRGLAPARIDDLVCPIGLAGVPGKRPQEIAVAVAGQLIAHYHAGRPEPPRNGGPGWKELRSRLDEGLVEPSPTASYGGAGTARDRSPTE